MPPPGGGTVAPVPFTSAVGMATGVCGYKEPLVTVGSLHSFEYRAYQSATKYRRSTGSQRELISRSHNRALGRWCLEDRCAYGARLCRRQHRVILILRQQISTSRVTSPSDAIVLHTMLLAVIFLALHIQHIAHPRPSPSIQKFCSLGSPVFGRCGRDHSLM